MIMVAAINDKYLKKRYALHEAKKTYEHLKQEKTQKIFQIAEFFKWNLTQTKIRTPQNLALHFTHYLQNTTTLQKPEWKLINRQLNRGKIHLTQRETCRLLQEEIRKYIESKLDPKVSSLPPRN